MSKNEPQDNNNKLKAPWVTFRPEIKVLDCTIRDGGLILDHRFEDEAVRHVYNACVEAGIDYMEIGYKADRKLFAPDKFGNWKHCVEDDLRRIVGDNDTKLKLAAMADAEKTDYHTDILPADQSVLDVIRVATYIHQIPIAVDMIKDAADKGYEVTCNLMAVSVVQEPDLDQALETLVGTEASTIVVVDSFGALYFEQIDYLTRKYLKYCQPAGKEVGIHTHNNQQMAFANTVAGIAAGANRADATMNGIGRGAGNCTMELLIGFLRNPKFRLRPILDCVQNVFVPLQDQVEWGSLIPYNLTGLLNQHPRSAMQMRAKDTKDDYVAFYDKLMSDL